MPKTKEMTIMRGFKVTDAERKLRIGIAAGSLEDLKRKTIQKFKLNIQPDEIWFQVSDGTFIEGEEYFRTIPAQTLLVWQKKGKYAQTDAEILYQTIREVNEEYLAAGERVRDFFTENMKNKVYTLASLLKNIDNTKAKTSRREEHPEWFEGLETRSKTKEEYMFRRSQERIRTYYYRTRDELVKEIGTEGSAPRLYELLGELKTRLQEVDYYGCYFDRRKSCIKETHSTMKCLCDPDGVFICGGRWDKERCLYEPRHSINPYASREARVIFQTWNLDHRVERTRTVIPEIGRSVRQWHERGNKIKSQQVQNIYKQSFKHLFTTENIKLVHIVCHDKAKHHSAKPQSFL